MKCLFPIFGDELGVTIEVKPYSYSNLLKVIDTKIVTLIFEGELSTDIKKNLIKYETKLIADYSKIIDVLEGLDYVETRPTCSVMALDKRQFRVKNKNINKIDEWLDVDILGTTWGCEVTDTISTLYSSIQ